MYGFNLWVKKLHSGVTCGIAGLSWDYKSAYDLRIKAY